MNQVNSSGGLDNLCVRIFKATSQGAARKEAPTYAANQTFGVHCVPIHTAKGQLIIELFDGNLTIACYPLPLRDLVIRNPDRTYSKKQCFNKREQINRPEGVWCTIWLEAQFYSTRLASVRSHFNKDNDDINGLYHDI